MAKLMGHSYYMNSYKGWTHAGLVVFTPLLLLLLVSCSNPLGGDNNGGGPGQTPATTLTPSSLADLHWCGKSSMLFRDDGARSSPTATATGTATSTGTPTSSGTPTAVASAISTPAVGAGTPTTITSWDVAKAGLGFTVYLPVSLPAGTCLVSAQATIHDPTLGGNFLIGYLSPDHSALAISEAPLISQNTTFQCSTSGGSTKPTSGSGTPASSPLQYCTGAKGTTSIVLSAQRSVEYLQQLFTDLQPDVTWIPGT